MRLISAVSGVRIPAPPLGCFLSLFSVRQPPRMSALQKQFYEQVLACIRQHHLIAPEDLVVVGVSGGADSVVLLHVLHRLRRSLNIRLHVAHLNHQFRGDEAARDAEFVRQLAATLALPCTIDARDVPALIRRDKLSPQDAARRVRYQFFEAVADRVGAQKIATAHHADDQAETVLAGLIRGVGLRGLSGIQPINGRIIRPLLAVSREQIDAFANAERLAFVTDSSNLSRKYLRNAIRLDLLPLLKTHFSPAILTRLSAYAQMFREDAFFIDKIARTAYKSCCQRAADEVHVDVAQFSQHDGTLQRAMICMAFDDLTGARHLLNMRHIQAVQRAFTGQSTETRCALPRGIFALRSAATGMLRRGAIAAHSADASENQSVSVNVPGQTRLAQWRIDADIIETDAPESYLERGDAAAQVMDFERVAFPLIARFRLPGDRFCPLGMREKKRVKTFFIDRNVPRHARQRIPILADQRGIVLIAGYALDERVKVTRQTRTILRCRCVELSNDSWYHLNDGGADIPV